MAVSRYAFLFGLFVSMQLLPALAECPLDLSASNFTLAASLCSNQDDRAKCCRYINAFVAVSIARYANASGNLGVPDDVSDSCLNSVSQTMQMNGVPQNATVYCGYGTKIPVTYPCEGLTTVTQMLQSPRFDDVIQSCQVPLSGESDCRRCLNSGITYLHHLVGTNDNLTLSTCRDATYATLASRVDNASAVEIASCFFQVQGLISPAAVFPGISPPVLPPENSPSSLETGNPDQLIAQHSHGPHHHSYRISLVPWIGIAVTAFTTLLLIMLVILIRRKSRELEESVDANKTDLKPFPSLWPFHKFQQGPTSMFRRFSYKETKKATNNFSTVVGQGGFGTVYKGKFGDKLVLAVKRMNKISEQDENEFCQEIQLLARLHHRHLVSLRGFCIEKNERMLMYEFMENGSVSDQIQNEASGKNTLTWKARIQIAIDVANALEYLHFYCDPPLCHRDIKSSNILLDESYIAKVADFGLAHASKDGSVVFEPVNTDIRGTPGYMDPEYVVTQELTERSDVYSYGVVLLELVTGRQAIQDNRNLIEWSQTYMETESKLAGLVDPRLEDSFDFEQLQTIVTIVKWCTKKEGKERPSIKQVLRLLYESSDPMNSGFLQEIDDEEFQGNDTSGRHLKGKLQKSDLLYYSGDTRCLASSSSTSRSYCSRSFLLETGSPQSPQNNLSHE